MNSKMFFLAFSLIALILSTMVGSWQVFLIALIAVLAITFSFYIQGAVGVVLYYIGAIITVFGIILTIMVLIIGAVLLASIL